MMLTRTLALALAIMAFAGTSALARPGGPASEAAQKAAVKAQHEQDIRKQDLRHLAAGDIGHASRDVAPVYVPPATDPDRVYWSYDYEAQKPKTQPVADPGDGTPWPAIFAGLAIALLIGGAATAVVVRTRPPLGRASA